MSEKGFVSKKNLSRAWNRLFGKVLNSKEEIEANTSENMIAGAEAVKEVYSSLNVLKNNKYMAYADFYVKGDSGANVIFKDNNKKVTVNDYFYLSILEPPTGINIAIIQYSNIYSILNADTLTYANNNVGIFKVRGIKII